jgi:hypothetical protein
MGCHSTSVSVPGRWTRPGWWLVSRILATEPADPADGGQALLKGREPATRATPAVSILRTPGIILCLGRGADCKYGHNNRQRK